MFVVLDDKRGRGDGLPPGLPQPNRERLGGEWDLGPTPLKTARCEMDVATDVSDHQPLF